MTWAMRRDPTQPGPTVRTSFRIQHMGQEGNDRQKTTSGHAANHKLRTLTAFDSFVVSCSSRARACNLKKKGNSETANQAQPPEPTNKNEKAAAETSPARHGCIPCFSAAAAAAPVQ